MMQIVKQTHEEKIAMYMKLTKRELAEMLANRDINEAGQRAALGAFQQPHFVIHHHTPPQTVKPFDWPHPGTVWCGRGASGYAL